MRRDLPLTDRMLQNVILSVSRPVVGDGVLWVCAAVYIQRTPATTYLSNAYKAQFVDRVDDRSPFTNSFRNLHSVPEFWSVGTSILSTL